MKKIIVTTTIYEPSEAVRLYDAMPDWHLVVIGDKKTPPDYALERGTYVTPDEQERYDRALSEAIGWNCIQRRNFGFLWARELGADLVAIVDDDNVPTPGWGTDVFVGQPVDARYFTGPVPAFDPVATTNHPAIWHRGYPLPFLSRRGEFARSSKTVVPDVQANFWNGDPDTDAIARMEHAPECDFDPACFPIASDKPSPFNSQNTLMAAETLRDYFVFPHVGRQDDIWAAYYLQAKGYTVAYGKASVYHARNPHDLVRDMKNEYLGYENNHRIVEELRGDPERIRAYLPEEANRAFDLYRRHFD